METTSIAGSGQEPVQDSASQLPQKNKGGRPQGPGYTHHRLNIYLSHEEYKLFMDFVTEGWYDQNASGAGRYLLSTALQEWQKQGRKKM
jgi:hypothetical protein